MTEKELKRKIATKLTTCSRFIEIRNVTSVDNEISFVSVSYQGYGYLAEMKDSEVVKIYRRLIE